VATPQILGVDPSPAPRDGPAIDFRAVFEAEFAYVYHSLRRLGIRAQDLEDLTHDVFVTAYRVRADYDPSRPIRPWLFGIAFRVAVSHRRRAHHRLEVLEDVPEDARDTSSSAEQRLSEEQDRRLLGRAMDELDLDRRALIVMHDVDGCTMPQIASVLGIPLNTAYSRLRLAREQLSAHVSRLSRKRGAP
jgi:RNA polymerase sigma-70 factor (ECF subfamily)